MVDRVWSVQVTRVAIVVIRFFTHSEGSGMIAFNINGCRSNMDVLRNHI